MRTLNRPMFNMGGPIKQGIMHGIREPHASGGRAALVGNPVYPQTGGREHHNVVYSTGAKIASKAGPVFKRVGDFFSGRKKGWLPTRPQRKIGAHYEMIPGKGRKGKFKTGTFGKRISAADAKSVKVGEDIMGKTPFKGNKWNWIKQFSKENPGYATAAGLATATTPNLIYKTTPSVAGMAGTAGKTWIDAVLPGDQSKWFTSEKIAEDLKPIATPKVFKEKDTSTSASRAAFAKEQRDGRVQKYLDMMGYDRSKKTAVADALIDASKIVSDRGTLSTKNITGELINPAIQALSKRLDKPEQIREAVGLMMTKAGLEKEMYDAKPGVQLKAAIDYQKQFGGSLQNAYKQTGGTKSGRGNFAETLAVVNKNYGKNIGNQQSVIETIKFRKQDDPDFSVEDITILGDTDVLEKAKKAQTADGTTKENITEIILRDPKVSAETDDGLLPSPGIYVLGSAVVEVYNDGSYKRLN